MEGTFLPLKCLSAFICLLTLFPFNPPPSIVYFSLLHPIPIYLLSGLAAHNLLLSSLSTPLSVLAPAVWLWRNIALMSSTPDTCLANLLTHPHKDLIGPPGCMLMLTPMVTSSVKMILLLFSAPQLPNTPAYSQPGEAADRKKKKTHAKSHADKTSTWPQNIPYSRIYIYYM